MMKTLKRLGAYMGGRKYLLPCSVALSAVNGLLSLVPFILLWLVVRTLLIAKGNLSNTPPYRLCPMGFCHIGGKRVALLFGTDALSSCSIPYRNQHAPQSDATADACAIGLFRWTKHGAYAQNHR